MLNRRILVTGGGGYIGTNLVKELLKNKYKVKVIDTFWFGNHLKKNKGLVVKKKDLRKITDKDLNGYDTVIHLAAIANDPAAKLNVQLTWDINVIATLKLINLLSKKKNKKIIFASSGSVYGIKKEKKVTEDLSLEPISEYNKSKMIAERILLSYNKDIDLTILRPATVCGFSDCMRLDVSVNALTFNALQNNKILVNGGNQIRPNITMNDMINAYFFSLNRIFKKNRSINDIIFNVGFENYSIKEMAKLVKKSLGKNTKIIFRDTNDPRSYRQNSDRILNAGFIPQKKIQDVIIDLEEKFNNKKLKFKKEYFRVNTLKLIQNKIYQKK